MIRSTVGNAVSQRPLETLLQNRLGLKYMQSKRLVASGREALGMKNDEAWTPELEAECIKQYEKEHGPVKARDYSSPAAAAPPVDSPAKSFVKSTPAPSSSKPAVVTTKKEEESAEEPVVEPELTPEDDPANEEEAPEVGEEPAKNDEEDTPAKPDEDGEHDEE